MTRDQAAHYVVATLRRKIWLGSVDRPASLDKRLGSDGLGLDSLGVVEFLIELETTLDVRFPDEFWNRGPKTLGDVVEFVTANSRAFPMPPQRVAPTAAAARATGEVRDAIREQGFWRGVRWMATRGLERYGRIVYVRQRQLVLEKDLRAAPLPAPAATVPLEFRVARPADAVALEGSGFWPASRVGYWLRLFHERLAAGYHCFVALHQGQIVGVDWLSGKHADTALIGLHIEMRDGSCVGENLQEHRAYRHRGIGFALLAFGLEQAHKMGYERQVALVNDWNHRMLVSAVQLLDFRWTGELVTTWRLGRPRTAWRIDGPQGSVYGEGGTLTL